MLPQIQVMPRPRSVEIHEKVIGTFIEKHMFY
ncbi:Transposase [Shigella dysenteriae 1617]|uniref:Transposase n=1 Tax=Shigella dysenteriae 1617 TaxID=754093 RepID=A0A0A6ZWB4_SHIDY|nr:Transposase [Shigella dysenteriae 1617]